MYNKQWVIKSVDHLGHIIACAHKVKRCVCSCVWWKERQYKGNVVGERISENGSGSFF